MTAVMSHPPPTSSPCFILELDMAVRASAACVGGMGARIQHGVHGCMFSMGEHGWHGQHECTVTAWERCGSMVAAWWQRGCSVGAGWGRVVARPACMGAMGASVQHGEHGQCGLAA